MVEMARPMPPFSGKNRPGAVENLLARALHQAARELLLAESSDCRSS